MPPGSEGAGGRSPRPGGRPSRRWAAAAVAVGLIGAGVVVGVLLSGGGGGADDDGRRTPMQQAPATPEGTPPAGRADPAGPPALPAPAGPTIGASVNWLFNGDTYSPAQVDEQLAAMRGDGVRLGRTDAFWSRAEPEAPVDGAHRYDWAFADRVAGSLAAHGLEWLAIIGYAAPWAASVPGDTQSPPKSSADYAAYARAFAERYGRGGSFWAQRPDLTATPVTTFEIWNEPDVADFWAPAPDPARYMELYVQARRAIKAADPQARVLIGGLTGAPSFLPQLLAARPDARGRIDGVAIHTYSPQPLGALAEVRDARRALVALGMPDVALDVTEYGWVSRPANSNKYAPPGERPGHIGSTTSAIARSDCGVGAIVLYAWITPGRNPRAEGDWYGIRSRDGGPTASSRAFAAVASQADRLAEQPRVPLCGEP